MTKRPCPRCKKPRWSHARSWEHPPPCLPCRRKAGEPEHIAKKPRVWTSKKATVLTPPTPSKKKRKRPPQGK